MPILCFVILLFLYFSNTFTLKKLLFSFLQFMEWQLESMALKKAASIIPPQAKKAGILFWHQVSPVMVSLVLHNWFPIISLVELYKNFTLK